MDDTISREAAIDALERIFDRCEEIEAHFPDGDPDKTGYKMFPDYMTVWKYLHQLPSAERHGHWIENETSYADHPTKQTCNCSVGKRASTRPLGDWCRWCGSRMDLDGDTE